jgi:phage terminase large subunit-like protein
MPVNNRIVVGDTIHDMTPEYVAGAMALRRGVSHHCNPHRQGSQRLADWSNGHDNEASGEHHRLSRDLIGVVRSGELFEETPSTFFDPSNVIAHEGVDAEHEFSLGPMP